MRILSSGLVLFLFTVCALAQGAQASSAPPEIAVVQSKWRIDLYNPALDKDPLAASKEQQQEELQRQATAQANENRIRQGEPALPPVVRKSTPETKSAPETKASRLKAIYIYELKVRNTGQQEVRTLTWEYVFFEPGTKQEVGRLQFVSKVSMKPGQTRNIIVRSTEAPAGTVNATKAGKNARDQYSEQIVIRSIGYADGSVWSSASH